MEFLKFCTTQEKKNSRADRVLVMPLGRPVSARFLYRGNSLLLVLSLIKTYQYCEINIPMRLVNK